MGIELYNTLKGEIEPFRPIDPTEVKMYVCGPTVYDFAHIGNARSVIVYDVLFRLLSHFYPKVMYVRNITDVDDKIVHAAVKLEKHANEVSAYYYNAFVGDMKYLSCLTPTIEPKVTDHILEIIKMIENIIDSGRGYVRNGHVYFNASMYPDYGKLSQKNLDTLMHGERVVLDSNKLGKHDFVLWKPASEIDISIGSYWDSPWGNGRPGWHIECSAMSCKYLGSDFDIHGGGADLKFPHHENEIAQSCSANPGSKFAMYWVHNGFVTVNGEKMSKSLNNSVIIGDLRKNGADGDAIRYALLRTHYRKPLDWTDNLLHSSESAVDGLRNVLHDIDLPENVFFGQPDEKFLAAIAHDLNIPSALAELHNLSKLLKVEQDKNIRLELAKKLVASAKFIGFDLTVSKSEKQVDEREVRFLLRERKKARDGKDYARADSIRNKLLKMGVKVQDRN